MLFWSDEFGVLTPVVAVLLVFLVGPCAALVTSAPVVRVSTCCAVLLVVGVVLHLPVDCECTVGFEDHRFAFFEARYAMLTFLAASVQGMHLHNLFVYVSMRPCSDGWIRSGWFRQ